VGDVIKFLNNNIKISKKSIYFMIASYFISIGVEPQ